MKTAHLCLLVWAAIAASAFGSLPGPIVYVETKDSVVTYKVDVDRGAKLTTVEELEKSVPKFLPPETPLVIVADEVTSFRTISELLRRLKAAGIAKFSIALRDSRDAVSPGWITVEASKIK